MLCEQITDFLKTLGNFDQVQLLSYFQNYTKHKFSTRVTFVQQFNLRPAALIFNKKNNERLLDV